MVVYIVIGESECVYQDKIGGPFTEHPTKEIVTGFFKEKDAKNYIKNCKLKQPKHQSYGDTSYYKGGYFSMEYEAVSIN